MGHAKWDMQSEIDLNNQRIKHIFMVGRIKMYSERKTRGDTFRFSLSKWARNYQKQLNSYAGAEILGVKIKGKIIQ